MYVRCPRCGEVSLEILKTHAFCAGCNYSPDFEEGNAIPAWAIRAVNEAEEREAADALNGVPKVNSRIWIRWGNCSPAFQSFPISIFRNRKGTPPIRSSRWSDEMATVFKKAPVLVHHWKSGRPGF